MSAYVERHEQGCLLRFSDHTLFVGCSIRVIHQWTHRLVLPLFKNYIFFADLVFLLPFAQNLR